MLSGWALTWSAVGLAAAGLTLAVRLCLLAGSGAHRAGVDAWYYLVYARALRGTGRFPVQLPQYLLDIPEQWYPPAFPILLACLPERVRERYAWAVCPSLDAVHAALLTLLVLWATGDVPAAGLAGAFYAFTPTLVAEAATLNSRTFGSLALTIHLLALFASLERGGPWPFAATVLSAALVLLTHKMASQAMVAAHLVLALWAGRPLLFLLPLAGVASAFVLSGGFYRKVLLGHLDILAFWRRHGEHLGAHQILDSPLYRPADRTGGDRWHRPGLSGVVRKALHLAGHLPGILALPLLPAAPGAPSAISGWAWTVIALAAGTTFIRPLYVLGEGYKYLKFAAFPLAVLLASGARRGGAGALLAAAVLGASLAAIGAKWRALRSARGHRQAGAVSAELDGVLDLLARRPAGPVLCLPVHLADYLVYRTAFPVLWGAHSGGFGRLEGFFPVLQHPVEHFVRSYGVRYLLLDTDYVSPSQLRLPGTAPLRLLPLASQGRFALFECEGAEPSTGAAVPAHRERRRAD